MSDNSPVLTGWSMVAKFLRVHEQTAMKWHREDGLPVAKINGQIVTTTHSLEKWVVKNIKLTMYKL